MVTRSAAVAPVMVSGRILSDRIVVAAHAPAAPPGELPPLALGERFPVACDGDQERRGGAGDGVGEDLVGLRADDDLAASADDVGDAITTDADDVAPTTHSGALEISRPCVHCQAHYSS